MITIIKKTRSRIVPALILGVTVAALIGVGGCGGEAQQGRLKVAASIVPLADFCEQVGGDLVEVRCLVPPGAGCGHTFEPTAGSMEFVSGARVFVENGLGLESWATDVLKKVTGPGVVTVDASSAIQRGLLLPTREQDELENVKPGEVIFDPHVWLDPSLAALQVEAVRDGLMKADPANSSVYEENARAYIGRLEALDEELKAELSAVRGESFVATHPTWTYLARHYGLHQIGVIEELPGKEPSAKEIGRLIDKVRETRVKAVFSEPQLSPKALEIIAKDAGPDVKVAMVDPVGDPENPEVSDYIKLMRFDAGVIANALR